MSELNVDLLLKTIREVHAQHADDLCWMDVDRIFVAAGLSVPDRRVGDKEAMKANCARFIDTMCQGGQWRSYAELEAENARLRDALRAARLVPDDTASQCKVAADKWLSKTVEVLGREGKRFRVIGVATIPSRLSSVIEPWLRVQGDDGQVLFVPVDPCCRLVEE